MSLTGLRSVRGIKTYDQDRALVDYFFFHGELLADDRIQALMGTLTDRQNIVSLADICARCPTNGPSKATAVTDDLFMHADAIRRRGGVERVYVQRCGKCQQVVATPIAEQCNWCGHEWRGQNPLRTLWNEIATSTRENRDGLPPVPTIASGAEQSSGGLPPVVPPGKSPPRGNSSGRLTPLGSVEPSTRRKVSSYVLKPEDQTEVERFHQMILEEREWDDRKYLSKQLSDFKVAAKHYPQYPWGSTQVASLGHCLQMHFVNIGIIERYLNNDLERMRACLSLSARAGFLMGVGSGGKTYSGGCDCAHPYDMMNAAMCGDWAVLDRFAQVFPGPFKSGHHETVILCNGLYIALGHPIGDKALTDLRTAKASKHSRAMYDALIAIIERSPERLTTALKNVIKLHRKLDHTGSLNMMICIPAHALHRIWTRSGGQSLAADLKGYLWDDAVDLAFFDGSTEAKHHLYDINPVLSAWINDLPEHPDIQHLLDSIQVPST